MKSLQNTRKHRGNPETDTENTVENINTINTSERKTICKYTIEGRKRTFHYTFNKYEIKDQFGVLK